MQIREFLEPSLNLSISLFQNAPTNVPTGSPSSAPTSLPSSSPTASPSGSPTSAPSSSPSSSPSDSPSEHPTQAPTGLPSSSPTASCADSGTNHSYGMTFNPASIHGQSFLLGIPSHHCHFVQTIDHGAPRQHHAHGLYHFQCCHRHSTPLGRALANGADRGPIVRYTVKLVNDNKKSKLQGSFDQAELLVKLPADVRFIKARAKPLMRGWGKAALEPVHDAQAHTVSWRNVPLASGRKRKYEVLTEVLSTATSPLVFQAVCPSTSALFTQSNVTVRAWVREMSARGEGRGLYMSLRLPTRSVPPISHIINQQVVVKTPATQ